LETLNIQSKNVINKNLDKLAKIAVQEQYFLQPELWKPFGQSGIEKSMRDAKYHFSYLADSLNVNDPALFLDYLAWAKVLFSGLNFPLDSLTVNLKCMNKAIKEILPPEMVILTGSYIDAALEHIANCPEILPSFFSPDSPQYELATNYLTALLQGKRQIGSSLILDAVAHGTNVKDIYLQVFQPSQQEIGRLWQMNQISVAQEHFCTAATQMIMSQLFPYIFATQKNGHHIVATSIGGEYHEIGMRMVADFLEIEGWDTYYLGANTPTASILRTIEEQKADIVAISVTISSNISNVEELIKQIRMSSSNPGIKIMVGGYPFNISKDLWQQVGADGFARNAQDAVLVANQLL
jgi:MerR family transcriptional regulator, light-induced transcriptional regulator